ncbi:hypothetical protein [Micromonospora chalcea]|uniref:hypothetical protein n=1 Tax=Micromonospora chalcea TaxID=1874 RepID=UPI0004C3945F|nr:hypothetical protein [Micromonospora purpureochromogenes]
MISVDDITEPGQLLAYATRAQLEEVRKSTGFTHERIAQTIPADLRAGRPARRSPDAQVAHMSSADFSKKIKDPSDELLQQLDDRIMTLVPQLDRTGGLSALAVRLRRMGTRKAVTADFPAHRRRRMLQRPAIDELDVLSKASTLLVKLFLVPSFATQVCERNSRELDEVVQRLTLIGAAPPTPDNVDALILLGSIAGAAPAAFNVVETHLENALATHPFGFRMWRAVTTIVRLNEKNPDAVESIRPWVRAQLERAEELRERSLFPARSLDIELAIAVPISWSAPGPRDWVERFLRQRVENEHATVRERGAAAMGMWERATRYADKHDRKQTEDFLRKVVLDFRREAETGGVLLGLNWVAATLEHVLDTGAPVCNDWPRLDEPYLRVVDDAVESLESSTVPRIILEGTKSLVRHALLQNAGVYRRNAIDTLLAGGYTTPVVNALSRVLEADESQEWLRCRALFAISFLQDRDRAAEVTLQYACRAAKNRLDAYLDRSEQAPRAVASEMHAALFAIGDCFGADGADVQAARVRAALDRDLADLFQKSRRDPSLYRVGRAAAYLIAVTTRRSDDSSRSMLEGMVDHPDPVTGQLASWALRRFDGETFRALHELV